mmetsp:Transcript_2877/g.8564  ORF Transcript_2877/g.8564 Transcript_2877/m.8564 type:complete len:213 (-) Transcript_2877:2314-2952(-)
MWSPAISPRQGPMPRFRGHHKPWGVYDHGHHRSSRMVKRGNYGQGRRSAADTRPVRARPASGPEPEPPPCRSPTTPRRTSTCRQTTCTWRSKSPRGRTSSTSRRPASTSGTRGTSGGSSTSPRPTPWPGTSPCIATATATATATAMATATATRMELRIPMRLLLPASPASSPRRPAARALTRAKGCWSSSGPDGPPASSRGDSSGRRQRPSQ